MWWISSSVHVPDSKNAISIWLSSGHATIHEQRNAEKYYAQQSEDMSPKDSKEKKDRSDAGNPRSLVLYLWSVRFVREFVLEMTHWHGIRNWIDDRSSQVRWSALHHPFGKHVLLSNPQSCRPIAPSELSEHPLKIASRTSVIPWPNSLKNFTMYQTPWSHPIHLLTPGPVHQQQLRRRRRSIHQPEDMILAFCLQIFVRQAWPHQSTR